MSKLRIIVPLVLGLCSVAAFGQASRPSKYSSQSGKLGRLDQSNQVNNQQAMSSSFNSTRKDTVSSPWGLVLSGYTGFGQYPDLQVPLDLFSGKRADGKKVAQDSSQHSGLLMGAQLGTRFQGQHMFTLVRLEALQIVAIAGSPDTASSSYKRLDASVAVGTLLTILGWQHEPFVSAGYRRSIFQNVSNGHFLSTVYVGGGETIYITPTFSLYIDGAIGLTPTLSYNDGYSLSGKELKNTSSRVVAVNSGLSYAVSERSSLKLGLQMEKIQVNVPDVSEYNSVGLFFDGPARSASYILDTTAFTLGFTTIL